MTVLLDSNVVISLLARGHVHHEAAEAWLLGSDEDFATCPVTEGSFLRLVVREGQSASAGVASLASLASHPRHQFWPDTLSYREVSFDGVVGHRQVTDAYLVQLARARGGRLVTFDRGLAALHRESVELLPTN